MTLRVDCSDFILIARIELDSESATYNSTMLSEIKPIDRPDGWAHSHYFKSCLWFKLPSLPEPEKLKALFVFKFSAQSWCVPAIAKTSVFLLTVTMSQGEDNRCTSHCLLPSLSTPFYPVPVTVSTSSQLRLTSLMQWFFVSQTYKKCWFSR